MKPSEKQIEEIADELDFGMRCFYNLKTGEIMTIPDYDSMFYADKESWEEESKELDANWDDYFEFDDFDSHESFQIMEDFTESIDDARLQDRLVAALNKPKPFKNFKQQIDYSGGYREQWFDYKKECYIRKIKEQIADNEEYFL